MPGTCFGYPAEVQPGTMARNAAQPTPPGLHRMPATNCFSYPADKPDLRRMPYSSCFSYPADVPPITRTVSLARSAPLGTRKTYSTCFRY